MSGFFDWLIRKEETFSLVNLWCLRIQIVHINEFEGN